MHIGLENHPSTWRGACLVMTALFAWFDPANAREYFMAGLGAAGLIGVGIKEGTP